MHWSDILLFNLCMHIFSGETDKYDHTDKKYIRHNLTAFRHHNKFSSSDDNSSILILQSDMMRSSLLVLFALATVFVCTTSAQFNAPAIPCLGCIEKCKYQKKRITLDIGATISCFILFFSGHVIGSCCTCNGEISGSDQCCQFRNSFNGFHVMKCVNGKWQGLEPCH